jgi:serine protease Do
MPALPTYLPLIRKDRRMRDAHRSRLLGLFSILMAWALMVSPAALAAEPSASRNKEAPAKAAQGEESLAVFTKAAPESVDDLLKMEQHFIRLTEKLTPCTVGVQIGGVQGSGVIINAEGYVLTAGHVSGEPGRDANIILHDGRTVKGKTLGRNTGIDSGLIKITDKGTWPFAEMGSSKDLKAGQWCIAMGHHGGYQRGREPPPRIGRLLLSRDDVIRTDCPLVGGDSGGPLFDMNGRVIGIHSRISNRLTDNFHVPVQTYTKTWTHLAASIAWPGSAIMGVSGQDAKEGCQVTEVMADNPAEKAGLKAGDVITKVESDKIGSYDELVIMLAKHKAGEEVAVEFLRGGERQTQKVKLVARNPSPKR